MALGGGTFITQNKVLPGAYINVISRLAASATLSDRGAAAMAFELDWGPDGEVFEVTNGDFQKDSLKLFGYDYAHEKLKGLRDLFLNARVLYAYKLNASGAKASNAYATARYGGIRGNALTVVIQTNADDETLKDVTLLMDSTTVDVRTVTDASGLTDNAFVVWKKDAALTDTAGMPLDGGTNGPDITAANHQAFLEKIEKYTYNAIGIVADSGPVSRLYAAYCKRLRDEVGIKFQAVVYNTPSDYEGVINVKNKTADADWPDASLVYWVTGAAAGCEVNKSLLNRRYDGDFTIEADYTQKQLETAIKSGEFTLHKVDSELRVLSDVNSLVTLSDTKGYVFQENQTIRVVDQVANDIAVLFNTRYLGVVPNDEAGRVSLWADIVKHHEQLQTIRAIEDFKESDVEVLPGDTKKAVVVNDTITVVNAMAHLYMTAIVI